MIRLRESMRAVFLGSAAEACAQAGVEADVSGNALLVWALNGVLRRELVRVVADGANTEMERAYAAYTLEHLKGQDAARWRSAWTALRLLERKRENRWMMPSCNSLRSSRDGSEGTVSDAYRRSNMRWKNEVLPACFLPTLRRR